MAVGVTTLLDAVKREDLTDILISVDPVATHLLSGLQRGPGAKGVLHEFPEYAIAAAADNAQAEGFAFTVGDLTSPTRNNNICQIFAKHIQVSRTEQLIETIPGDRFAFEVERAMKEIAKDIELSLMGGSRATGSTATGRRMDGIIASISTMKTARASGDSLSETVFNDIMAMVKGVTDEAVDEIYTSTTLKRDISGFTGRSGTRFVIPATDLRVVNVTDHYQSDFGTHTIFWHRNLSNAANAKELVGINTNYWAISYLDPLHSEKLPKESIDRDRAQLVAELTLEDRAEKSSFYYSAFTG